MSIQESPEWGRETKLTSTEAKTLCEELGNRVGFPIYERIFFNRPVTQAIQEGFWITKRSLYEAVESPTAELTARTVANLVSDKTRPVVDLFAGTGQMTYAFSQVGLDVIGNELDTLTLSCAKHNLELMGVLADWHQESAIHLIDQLSSEGKELACIYLDPPWAGNYEYNFEKPFYLENTDPQSGDLVDACFRKLRVEVVALKIPLNVDMGQLTKLAQTHEATLLFQRQLSEINPPPLCHATAYFFHTKNGFHSTTETVYTH